MGFNCRRKSMSKDVFRRLKNIQNATLQIGWFDARYEDGTPVSTVAMIQEFGAPEKNIPPRPFMRPAKMEHAQEWKELTLPVCRPLPPKCGFSSDLPMKKPFQLMRKMLKTKQAVQLRLS